MYMCMNVSDRNCGTNFIAVLRRHPSKKAHHLLPHISHSARKIYTSYGICEEMDTTQQ